MSDNMSPEEAAISEVRLKKGLKTQTWGRGMFEIHDRLDSTNRRAREMAMAGADEGTVVLAETQTAGRGRLGRSWHSPSGQGLYFSVIVHPQFSVERLSLLTPAAALGAMEAVSRFSGYTPRIKWPNDLLLDGRKIAGLLTEMEFHGRAPKFAVLGLGINVNLKKDDLPPEIAERAGSLAMISGRVWDRTGLLAVLLAEMEDAYLSLVNGFTAQLVQRFRQACETLGARVRIAQGKNVLEGLAVDIDAAGRLVVEQAGRFIHVNAGEVTLVRQ